MSAAAKDGDGSPAGPGARAQGRPGGLAELAMLVSWLAQDAAACGPEVEALCPGFADKVATMRAVARGMVAQLAAQREGFLRRQMAALDLDGQRALKLNVGGKPLESWVTIDLHPAQLRMDLRWSWPFAAGSARFIHMCHVLEHFNYPGEALSILRQARRALEPGGVIRIVVPDLERYVAAYAARDRQFFERRTETWQSASSEGTLLARFLHYAGAGYYPGVEWHHKFGYDYETLSALLMEAGFPAVRRCAFMASTHPELRIDDTSAVAHASFKGISYSLFVEGS
jgi:hypothetical protein